MSFFGIGLESGGSSGLSFNVTNPQVGDYLAFNGSAWVNKSANTQSPAPGSEFFPVDDILLAGPTTQTSFQTLSNTPDLGTLDTDSTPIPIWSGVVSTTSAYAASGKCLIQAYLSPQPVVAQSIPAGSWLFSFFTAYDHNISGQSQILANIARGIAQSATAYVTGSGNTRTLTASSAIFVASGGQNQLNASNADAATDPSLCTYVQLPGGVFPIIGFTSTTVVTIWTPSTYTNDGSVGSQVALTLHYPLFEALSSPILSTTATLYATSLTEPQFSTNASDVLSMFFFGQSTASFSGAASTPSYFHGKSTEYTKIGTPITIPLVGEFSGEIETPAAKNYVIDLYAAYDYIVNSLSVQTSAGTCTAQLLIGSNPITGISAVSCSSVLTTAISTANNIQVQTGKLSLVISNVSNAADLSFTIAVTRS